MKPAAHDVTQNPRTWALVMLFIATLLNGLTSPVEITVMPHVVAVGGTVRVRCRVIPDERNRHLDFGIEGYTHSEHDLEGRQSQITYEWLFDHIPCDAGLPYCELTREDGKKLRVTDGLVVAGCNQSTGRHSYTPQP